MKKIAALVETTQDRAVTVKSGLMVFRFPQQQRVPSAQLKSSVFKSKSITMNVSGEKVRIYIFIIYKLIIFFCVSVAKIKNMILTRYLLIRCAFRKKC